MISICFLFLFSFEVKAQPASLSGDFVDYSREPLVIYGRTFPGAVIYQYGKMYAPAMDFLSCLGIQGNFSYLPDQFVINGLSASTSLLGIGPDRYTGESIYYLDVTGTLKFLGIDYSQNDWKIIVNASAATPVPLPTAGPSEPTPGATPELKNGAIMMTLNITDDIDTSRGGTIKLFGLKGLENINRYYYLSSGTSYYDFLDIPPGEYRIAGEYYFTEKGELIKDSNSEGYYFELKSCIASLSIFVTLKSKEKFHVNLSSKDFSTSTFQTERKYVNSASEYNNY